jgi:type VI protein secretion system component Hcp
MTQLAKIYLLSSMYIFNKNNLNKINVQALNKNYLNKINVQALNKNYLNKTILHNIDMDTGCKHCLGIGYIECPRCNNHNIKFHKYIFKNTPCRCCNKGWIICSLCDGDGKDHIKFY